MIPAAPRAVSSTQTHSTASTRPPREHACVVVWRTARGGGREGGGRKRGGMERDACTWHTDVRVSSAAAAAYECVRACVRACVRKAPVSCGERRVHAALEQRWERTPWHHLRAEARQRPSATRGSTGLPRRQTGRQIFLGFAPDPTGDECAGKGDRPEL